MGDLVRWGSKSYSKSGILQALGVAIAVVLFASLTLAHFGLYESPSYRVSMFTLSALVGAVFGERLPRQTGHAMPSKCSGQAGESQEDQPGTEEHRARPVEIARTDGDETEH